MIYEIGVSIQCFPRRPPSSLYSPNALWHPMFWLLPMKTTKDLYLQSCQLMFLSLICTQKNLRFCLTLKINDYSKAVSEWYNVWGKFSLQHLYKGITCNFLVWIILLRQNGKYTVVLIITDFYLARLGRYSVKLFSVWFSQIIEVCHINNIHLQWFFFYYNSLSWTSLIFKFKFTFWKKCTDNLKVTIDTVIVLELLVGSIAQLSTFFSFCIRF